MVFGNLVRTGARQAADAMQHGMSGMHHGMDGMGGISGMDGMNGMGGMDMGKGMDMGMTPFLFGDARSFFVLSAHARVTTTLGLFAALAFSLLFALLSTLFSNWSKRLERDAANAPRGPKRNASPLLVFSTVTFALRLLLHYVAMLLVMTMNVWVILAVVVGHGLGHLLFEVFEERTAGAREGERAERARLTCGCSRYGTIQNGRGGK